MSATSSVTSRQESKTDTVVKVPPLYRSRTDSVILYTAPSIVEAGGSTFYIRKNGQIDYNVLLKVWFLALRSVCFQRSFHTSLLIQALHKITLRENICTVRVCEVVLSLTSTLIDLGVLANNTKALLSSLVKSGDDNKASASEAAASAASASNATEDNNEIARPPSANDTKDNDNKQSHSPETTAAEASTAEKVSTFSLHNTFMDIVIRQAFQPFFLYI